MKMYAGMASGVLLALGCADLAVLNLLLAPRLTERRDTGRLVAFDKAPRNDQRAACPPASVTTGDTPKPPACPPPPEADAPGPEAPALGAEAAPDIEFDLSEVKVPGGDATVLVRRVAGELAADPGKQLLIRGHADRLGTAEGNLALSRLRANAVLRLLAAYGAPTDRVTIEAVGDADPRDRSDTPVGWARNRRVQLLWR
jgi:outer membrane protein OmpA-like peptidoglycan-associated protein